MNLDMRDVYSIQDSSYQLILMLQFYLKIKIGPQENRVLAKYYIE